MLKDMTNKIFFKCMYYGWKNNKTLTSAIKIIVIVKLCH